MRLTRAHRDHPRWRERALSGDGRERHRAHLRSRLSIRRAYLVFQSGQRLWAYWHGEPGGATHGWHRWASMAWVGVGAVAEGAVWSGVTVGASSSGGSGGQIGRVLRGGRCGRLARRWVVLLWEVRLLRWHSVSFSASVLLDR